MATLTVPYSFNPNTAIVASEMNTNFGAVKTFVEALSAGTNIDSAAITTDKLATNTIQLLTPTGSIVQYGGNAAPTGWMLCNGAPISRTTYAALFAVIGTTYGVGDGSTTFNLPNFGGRVPAGLKGTAGEPFLSNGETGGSRTSTASHTHDLQNHTHALKNHIHDLSSHTHALGNHTHSGTTGDDSPDHTHSIAGSTGAGGIYQLATWINNVQLSYGGATGGASVRHQHTFTSGAPSTNTSGAPSNNSSGVPSDNTSNTPSTNVTGASSADASNGNLQPYLTVNFIIKL